MRIVVPRETAQGERRVALVPESSKKLIQAGYEIVIESGAGEAAGFPDSEPRRNSAHFGSMPNAAGSIALLGRLGPPCGYEAFF